MHGVALPEIIEKHSFCFCGRRDEEGPGTENRAEPLVRSLKVCFQAHEFFLCPTSYPQDVT